MNSTADDPYPPSVMAGLDDSQMLGTDLEGTALDNNTFFNSAFTADSASLFFGDDTSYNSTISSPNPLKDQTVPADAQVAEYKANQSTSPESSSHDSSSDSSGHRKRKSSSRSSHSPENLVMAGPPNSRAWNSRTSPEYPQSASEIPQQFHRQQRPFDLAPRPVNEQDFDIDSASSSPGFPNAGPSHVVVPTQDSPSNASAGSFARPNLQGIVCLELQSL